METRVGIKSRLPVITCLFITYQGLRCEWEPVFVLERATWSLNSRGFVDPDANATGRRVQTLFRQFSVPLPGRWTSCIGRVSSAKRATETEIRGVLPNSRRVRSATLSEGRSAISASNQLREIPECVQRHAPGQSWRSNHTEGVCERKWFRDARTTALATGMQPSH
jgi:hypothetical protein